jgi:ABC-2 type transport system permease protein
MSGFLQQLRMSLRLYFRNPMAMIYGYAFPAIFLVAFWVLYRYDRVPLIRHMGELLTVTVLGGACFGLPTTLVSERERGVWKRIRLAPVSTISVVGSTIAARYVLLVIGGLLQLALAMGFGMPLPRHPIELWIAFTAVAVAFLGLGLVIATLADNVPAVQALGQCIFLPMLIIGGVAVPLASLPDWAQHLSAFFPGRYAVEAIQATVNGAGLDATGFALLALVTIGAAGALAGGRLFRWDAQQRFMASRGKSWVAVALAAWIAVGVAAETRGHIATQPSVNAQSTTAPTVTPSTSPAQGAQPTDLTPAPSAPALSSPRPVTVAPPAPARPAPPESAASATQPRAIPPEGPATHAPVSPAGPAPSRPPAPPPEAGASIAPAPPAPAPQIGPSTWQAVTMKNIEEDIVFNRVPPDGGVVTPIATPDRQPDPDVQTDLDALSGALPTWAPGKVADPVQRVRNLLYVPAVVDVFQLPTEPFVPLLVYDQIQASVPKDDLIKILYWIAVHADEGDDSAIAALQPLGVQQGSVDREEVRGRAGVYAVKLLGRITGKRPG